MNKEALVNRLNASAQRQKADIVIKNGKIMDVYNQEWIYEDIAITDGVIVGLGEYEGENTIDAEGQMIVPVLLMDMYILSRQWLHRLSSLKQCCLMA